MITAAIKQIAPQADNKSAYFLGIRGSCNPKCKSAKDENREKVKNGEFHENDCELRTLSHDYDDD